MCIRIDVYEVLLERAPHSVSLINVFQPVRRLRFSSTGVMIDVELIETTSKIISASTVELSLLRLNFG